MFKVPNSLDWDIAISLSVTPLTPYHALKEASAVWVLKIEFVYPTLHFFVQGVGILSIHKNLFKDGSYYFFTSFLLFFFSFLLSSFPFQPSLRILCCLGIRKQNMGQRVEAYFSVCTYF
jgi:hypothetical protein